MKKSSLAIKIFLLVVMLQSFVVPIDLKSFFKTSDSSYAMHHFLLEKRERAVSRPKLSSPLITASARVLHVAPA